MTEGKGMVSPQDLAKLVKLAQEKKVSATNSQKSIGNQRRSLQRAQIEKSSSPVLTNTFQPEKLTPANTERRNFVRAVSPATREIGSSSPKTF